MVLGFKVMQSTVEECGSDIGGDGFSILVLV